MKKREETGQKMAAGRESRGREETEASCPSDRRRRRAGERQEVRGDPRARRVDPYSQGAGAGDTGPLQEE